MSTEIRIEYPDGSVVKEFTDKTSEQLEQEGEEMRQAMFKPPPINPLYLD